MEEPVTFTPRTPEPNRDGGQAFPAADTGVGPPWGGMSLRDWFAGQALMGMGTWTPGSSPQDAEAKAAWAYEMADAMLAAREASNA